MANPEGRTPAPQLVGELTPTPAPADANGPASVYLHPAQMHVATAPCAIRTLLGSCVAVCVWDQESHVGGAVHYLLPRGRHSNGETGRYGTLAIPALVRAVCALGGRPGSLRAKVFGGARVLPGLRAPNGASLGDSNVAVAWQLLATENVPVVGSDVGGEHGRRVLFHVEDGAAWVWRLHGS
jgi:chemotaxis protein CheD